VTVTSHVLKMWKKFVLCDRIDTVALTHEHGILSRK